MSQNDDAPPPREPGSPSRHLLYGNAEDETLDEITDRNNPEPSHNTSGESSGYEGSLQRFPSTRDPWRKMEDASNVVLLYRLPTNVRLKEQITQGAIAECGIGEDAVVNFSKLPDQVFIYNLSSSSQARLRRFFERHYPNYGVRIFMGIIPYRHEEDITQMILNVFEHTGSEQMPYTEIYQLVPQDAYLFLTHDFPYDTNRLVEVNNADFRGMRRKYMCKQYSLDPRHLICLISVRRLAPIVHRMISTTSKLLGRDFLRELRTGIEADAPLLLENQNVAYAVDGEAVKKPLEHLVTCVPGVEVVWSGNRKVIRKLELPERAGAEQAGRAQPAQNAAPDSLRVEQEIVKALSDILKRPSNLYMSIDMLPGVLEEKVRRLGRTLRQFITERPKHFQILGEGDYEVVTLSHRAQIKRVCNDLQKVLRPRKPKCIASADVASEFARHWRTTNESDRQFNVEDFGVCYLDDLLVTIPQHWGVHCSEYVSTDGAVVRRSHGEGEEDIPDFVPNDAAERVYAWIPRHNQTESQKKALALLKQQTLNMFRGDPSADELINKLSRTNRVPCQDYQKLLRLAHLRANRPPQRDALHHPRDVTRTNPSETASQNVHLPCNFELAEKTFVPLYHRFCGEQVTLSHYGVRDLYELFDSMQDTFIASGNGQDRIILLTNDARREIIERRCVDILRMCDKPMMESEVLQFYRSQQTMQPHYQEQNVEEIRRALNMSNLVARSYVGHGAYVYQAQPAFQCREAVSRVPDIEDVLLIFMQSCSPLTRDYIRGKFAERTRRILEDSVLRYLETLGAIRRVNEFDERYDLHDIARVVRNLVYQMNDDPGQIYTVDTQPFYFGANPPHNHSRGVSVASLLLYSGDFTYRDPGTIRNVMSDFAICFERISDHQFRLRPELNFWPPPTEENEPPQNRRSLRDRPLGHLNHRGANGGGGGARNRPVQRSQRRPGGNH